MVGTAQNELRTAKSHVTSKKTDTYKGPSFQLDHTYWGEWNDIKDDSGYVGNRIKVTNTSEVPISVRVFLDLDDGGMIWDANVRNSEGSPVETRWIEIGTIQPGGVIDKDYWWAVFNQSGEPFAETFEVTFNLAPQVTIDYKNFKAFNQSKAKITTIE